MGANMKHYTKDGEYEGKTHKMNGKIHTGAEHSEASEVVSHNKRGTFKMKGSAFYGKSNQSPLYKVLDHTNTKCWKGHAPKAGEPKTKISSRTGRRVNNCS